jgi:hypothetical protein
MDFVFVGDGSEKNGLRVWPFFFLDVVLKQQRCNLPTNYPADQVMVGMLRDGRFWIAICLE